MAQKVIYRSMTGNVCLMYLVGDHAEFTINCEDLQENCELQYDFKFARSNSGCYRFYNSSWRMEISQDFNAVIFHDDGRQRVPEWDLVWVGRVVKNMD